LDAAESVNDDCVPLLRMLLNVFIMFCYG